MSLNFSRRDFMKLSAVAALAVAASGLMTGCSDSTKPYIKGDGTISQLNVSAKVTKVAGQSNKDGQTAAPPKFQVEITNNRDNEIAINVNSFAIEMNDTQYTGTQLSVSPEVFALSKGNSKTVTVSLASSIDAKPNSGTNLKLYYRPDNNYTEYLGYWLYENV